MIRSHLFIVFCGHGANALGIIRSLHEYGLSTVLIVASDAPDNYADKSRFCGRIHYTPTSEDALEFLINTYGHENNAPFLITCDDSQAALIDANYNRLRSSFHIFNCGGEGCLSEFLNKNTQCAFAEKIGFLVPRREVVQKGVFPKDLRYPVITKTITSNDGNWKGDSFLCKTESELKSAFGKIKAETLLVQEYLEKVEEVAFQGFSVQGGQEVIIPFYSVDKSFSPICFGGYLTYYRVIIGDSIVKKIKSFLRELHYSGIFEIEFVRDNLGDLYFLEINLRCSAYNYAITYGGVNMPVLWAKMTLGESSKKQIEQIELKSSFIAMNEFQEFNARVLTGKISFWQWLREIRSTNVYYWFYRGDNRPFLLYISRKIKKALRKIWR